MLMTNPFEDIERFGSACDQEPNEANDGVSNGPNHVRQVVPTFFIEKRIHVA